jgi:anaerobic magnesium-protoporphyrin IX monomethyl ester cyclase
VLGSGQRKTCHGGTKMKILLVDPPFYRFIKYYNRYFPLGLAYLAAVLRDSGHQVLIYDGDAKVEKAKEMDFSALEEKYPEYIKNVNRISHPIWDEWRDVLKDYKPDMVGISVYTVKIASSFRIAQIVKDFNPDIPVVFGGPHPSVKSDESLKIAPCVDFVLRGEAEFSFARLVETIEKKGPISDIKGLSYRKDGQITHNPDTDFIEDLDRLPFPARDLLINKDTYTSEDMGLLMSGRGCPFECTFCSSAGVWGRKVRFRSIENVLDEMQQVKSTYGTVQFSFKDDIFTINTKRVLEFCKLLKERKLNIKWDCNARVNLIDKTLLTEMKSAGCNGIKLGIESGSDRILKDVMKKKITVAQIKNAAELIRKAGIHWTGYFMMGLPTETEQEMNQTLELMRQIKPDFASLSVYEPLPGTQLYHTGVAAGLVSNKRTLDDFFNISPKYYYFKNINNRIDTMPDDKFKAIEQSMKTSFHRYNRGPARIYKRAKARSALYLKKPAVLKNDITRFLAWLK